MQATARMKAPWMRPWGFARAGT